jgi:predicted dithiol-disulfide oxidoreductase (DUF899 family)
VRSVGGGCARNFAFYNYTRQNPSVTEREGLSVFAKDDEGTVFHTYSAYARGIDMVNVAYHYLDLVPRAATRTSRSSSGSAVMTSTDRRHIVGSAPSTF